MSQEQQLSSSGVGPNNTPALPLGLAWKLQFDRCVFPLSLAPANLFVVRMCTHPVQGQVGAARQRDGRADAIA